MKTTTTIILMAIGLFLSSCSSNTAKEEVPEQPNILFIAVDDLRPELACYGATHISSPHIDALSEAGTRFDRAYCNIPVCGASRASLMTGLRPARNRFLSYFTWAEKEAEGIVNLPTQFKNQGYYTISNGKIFHHDMDSKESWDDLWHPESASASWRDYVLAENHHTGPGAAKLEAPVERAEVPDHAYKDGKTADKTIEDLKKLKESGKPFFLAAGFLKPHLPFNAPEPYWAMYDGKVTLPDNNYTPEGAPREALHTFGELRSYKGIPAEGPVSDEMALQLIQGYNACVSYTDAQIGKVLQALEDLELDKNTIVILWGDHGWNLREHGLWCKHCNFENALHTPLIVKVPWQKQVASSNEIVEFVDIYPSLCELAGLELPEHLEGNSFSELLVDPEAKSDGLATCQWYAGVTTIRDQYFYTEWFDNDDQSYARMLYDHDTDPEENVNVSEHADNAAIVEEMSKVMRENRIEDYFAPGVEK